MALRIAGAFALVLAGGCGRTLYVNDACAAFAPETTPRAATQLRRRGEALELLVPFVPGATQEGDAVLAVARREPVSVVIYPSERYAHVLRVEGEVMVIEAKSPEHAASVAKLMCVEPIAAAVQ